MSKAVMVECLDEAIDMWFAAMKGLHQEFDLNDSTAFVTLAVALYQERMRPVVPVLQVTPSDGPVVFAFEETTPITTTEGDLTHAPGGGP